MEERIDLSVFDQYEDAKKRALRARNNEACRKCRKNKKMKFETMEQRVAELEKENGELKQKLQSACNEIAILLQWVQGRI